MGGWGYRCQKVTDHVEEGWKLSNACIKGVSLSLRTLKNSFVQGRHSCGYWRGIILISNLDYFISLRDCFLCAYPCPGCLLAPCWWKIYSPGWNWGLFRSSGKEEAGGDVTKAAPPPPLSSQWARSSESGKEKQVGGERMQSASVPGRDEVF